MRRDWLLRGRLGGLTKFIEGLAGRSGDNQYLDVGGVLGSVGSGGSTPTDEPERKSFLTPPRKK